MSAATERLLAAVLLPTKLAGAACIGRAPLFDADVDDETADERQGRHHRAQALCARCPVQERCAAVAEQLPTEAEGIWAGLALHPRRRRPKRPA